MKKHLERILLLVLTATTIVPLSVVMADADGFGRDTRRYTTGLAATFRGDHTRWDDRGHGVWRTDDGDGNPVLNDSGYAAYDLTALEDDGFDLCRVLCEKNQQCKGVEYTAFANSMAEAILREPIREGDREYYLNKCEIHYDPLLSCDESIDPAGSIRPAGSQFNGCWEKLH